MPLSDVLATSLLAIRRGDQIQRAAAIEASALLHSSSRSNFISDCRLLTTEALRLCLAESAGISIFDKSGKDELTWVSIAGTLSEFEGRRFPRRHSLCGVSVDTKAIELFVEPHRYFQWMQAAGITIEEALVCPLCSAEGDMYGTIWVMTHYDLATRFEQPDARILIQLAAAAGEMVRAEALRERL